nr:unnamed protein product [Digitaria exilis]
MAVAPITPRMSGIQRLRHDLGAPRGASSRRTHPVATHSQTPKSRRSGCGASDNGKDTSKPRGTVATVTDAWASIRTPHVSYSRAAGAWGQCRRWAGAGALREEEMDGTASDVAGQRSNFAGCLDRQGERARQGSEGRAGRLPRFFPMWLESGCDWARPWRRCSLAALAFVPNGRLRLRRVVQLKKTLEEDTYTNDEGIAYCSRRRRRKKTATDSIEKALDEDAPGLLELFPKRTSLLKLSIARHEKGEKAIYCLSCLISLIEQARYLHFRDCPVEWGWCRDLQSFIFVFRSHNRIVLERPEYGYATYFFEVVQSLPIEWQIRRLVTAMKLSGCGRTALIENKPLLVGEDLTEGEARVLEEYGWIRNTGLGTMVNYRDRVVHDRWTERSVNDWRAKIGKLLMTGYAEGQSITIHGPKKVVDLLEATGDAEFDIKLEDPF